MTDREEENEKGGDRFAREILARQEQNRPSSRDILADLGLMADTGFDGSDDDDDDDMEADEFIPGVTTFSTDITTDSASSLHFSCPPGIETTKSRRDLLEETFEHAIHSSRKNEALMADDSGFSRYSSEFDEDDDVSEGNSEDSSEESLSKSEKARKLEKKLWISVFIGIVTAKIADRIAKYLVSGLFKWIQWIRKCCKKLCRDSDAQDADGGADVLNDVNVDTLGNNVDSSTLDLMGNAGGGGGGGPGGGPGGPGGGGNMTGQMATQAAQGAAGAGAAAGTYTVCERIHLGTEKCTFEFMFKKFY